MRISRWNAAPASSTIREWKKVEAGVYTGFSIGGAYVKRYRDGAVTRYVARPSEVSLVDNPCNPDAVFQLVKQDGSTEARRFTRRGKAQQRRRSRAYPGGPPACGGARRLLR